MTHHEFVSKARVARDSSVPHDRISGGNPNPRKLSVPSMMMAMPKRDTIMKEIWDHTLGTIW